MQHILHQFQDFRQVPSPLLSLSFVPKDGACAAAAVSRTRSRIHPQHLFEICLGRFVVHRMSVVLITTIVNLFCRDLPRNAGRPWPLSWHPASPQNLCRTTKPLRDCKGIQGLHCFLIQASHIWEITLKDWLRANKELVTAGASTHFVGIFDVDVG